MTEANAFNPKLLDGKVAVVLGGTGVLCGALAEGFAQAGAQVVLGGRCEVKAKERLASIESAGGKGIFVPYEAEDPESSQRTLNGVISQLGRVDVLVNGAGVNSGTPFLDISPEEVERIMRVNFAAPFRACQIWGRYFIDQQIPGSIINLGSVSGLNPLSRVFTYSASKAALHNLTRNLAREWGPYRIRVNTLVPGFFPAEQNRQILTEERQRQILDHTPLGRFGEAKELIATALLLASNEAGSFITGQEFVVDGGFSSVSI